VINKFKLILLIVFFIYQTSVFSKTKEDKSFNPKYLSNYLSAIISKNNDDIRESVKYFSLSKTLSNEHDKYLKKQILALALNSQIQKSINIIKSNKEKNNINFFEAKLLLLINNFKKGEFDQNIKLLNELKIYKDYSNYQYIIYEVFKNYNDLFITREININNKNNFGKLSLINEAFANCYLNKQETGKKFINLINSDDGEYTRYLFFYFNNLIENKDFDSAKQISKTLNILDVNLLVNQSKYWIDRSNYKKFNQFFSCKDEADIIAEFLFLISNFYAAEKNFEKSNFYLNLSIYLNPKFYFNLTHLLENSLENKNYNLTRKILKNFKEEDEIYYWYKLKKMYQIIYNEEGTDQALNYIEAKFNKYTNPSIKILYDMANIYQNSKKFDESIKYYSKILQKINKNSETYADVLYKRGSSYERLGDNENSDKDLLKSLSIKPNDPYVLNYLGYGWLERGYKIKDAIDMLDKAYNQRQNDPFIIDSVGWGYFLIGDYVNAEIFLRKAIQLMPGDPIINDHYGDVLWKLNRKMQAKYYWQSSFNSKETEEELKKKIKIKLLKGLDKV
tara:strand:- start:835 stop:2523 length:1689 start_codon:yes stop_codon:yes gene_type:complete